MTVSTPLYSLEKCNFYYDQTKALHEITLHLKTGSFYGIIGPNGSGKTTLLDLLLGHTTPASGLIKYRATPLAAYSRQALAKEISLVPQEFQLGFEYTVYQVVMMGRHPYIPRFGSPSELDHHLVEENLKLLDIWEYRSRPASMLSGGEKQRVVVARALSQDCPVLLLDEATSNLDIQHTIDIMKIIHTRVKEDGLTAIATIHDLNLAGAFCEQIIGIKNGRIQMSGETNQVLTSNCVKELFNVSATINKHPVHNSVSVNYEYR